VKPEGKSYLPWPYSVLAVEYTESLFSWLALSALETSYYYSFFPFVYGQNDGTVFACVFEPCVDVCMAMFPAKEFVGLMLLCRYGFFPC